MTFKKNFYKKTVLKLQPVDWYKRTKAHERIIVKELGKLTQ
jgi:hypothetical protein